MQAIRRALRRIQQLWLWKQGLNDQQRQAEDERITERAERRQDGRSVLDGSGHDTHLY